MKGRFALVLALLAGYVGATEDQYALITEAEQGVDNCKKAGAFIPLFHLAASGQITGADPMEHLADANEKAFLKCPYEFLVGLKGQDQKTQAAVSKYFGIAHAPWELGAELRKWEHDKTVGALVRSRFGAYLAAKDPQ